VYRIRTKDFNLDHTLSCGQVFRWEKKDKWTGIVNRAVIRAKQENDELIIKSSLPRTLLLIISGSMMT